MLPKSVNPQRSAKDNFEDVLNFCISDEDMATLATIDRDWRMVVPLADRAEGLCFRDDYFPQFPFMAEVDKLGLIRSCRSKKDLP